MDQKNEIKSLPEQYHLLVDRLEAFLDPLVKKSLRSILVFGVTTKDSVEMVKNSDGSCALSDASPAIMAIKLVRKS
jgi:delta-aminolevulinic acid dehydratase/porphobilinogen synthase